MSTPVEPPHWPRETSLRGGGDYPCPGRSVTVCSAEPSPEGKPSIQNRPGKTHRVSGASFIFSNLLCCLPPSSPPRHRSTPRCSAGLPEQVFFFPLLLLSPSHPNDADPAVTFFLSKFNVIEFRAGPLLPPRRKQRDSVCCAAKRGARLCRRASLSETSAPACLHVVIGFSISSSSSSRSGISSVLPPLVPPPPVWSFPFFRTFFWPG